MMKLNVNDAMFKASFQASRMLEGVNDYTRSGKMTHKKAFMLGALAALGSELNTAFAAPAEGATGAQELTTDPLKRVATVICDVSDVLRGPIGVGVIIVCIVLAGLSLAFGGKNSTSLLISALMGAVVVFGARTLIGFVVTGTGSVSCAGTAAAPAGG